MKQTYIAQRAGNPESLPPVTDINDFAFFHSDCFKDIAGERKHERGKNSNDLYVRISHGKKKIFLKYHVANITKDTVILSYSNLCRLGLIHQDDMTVEVEESCAFLYSWNNGNSAARLGYKFTIISLLVTILSLFITIF